MKSMKSMKSPRTRRHPRSAVRAEQSAGEAGQGKAGQGKTGQGKTGQGKAGQGKSGEGKAGQGEIPRGETGCRKTGGRCSGARRSDGRKSGRRVDFPRAGRTGPRRWIPSWRLVSGLSALGAAVLGGLFAVLYLQLDLPAANREASQQATVYYWADGSRMVSVGDVNRQDVTLDHIPASVRNAVVAAENEDFYDDFGVSVMGIARAALSVLGGGETQGGSTITQQYVKNRYLTQEQTATRKIKEFVLALKVSNRMTKPEILEGYLNTSWFGRDSYGIQAAAHAYYGVPASELNPSQSALLATVLKGADSYDPSLSTANHRRAVDRWSWVLDRQVETGALTAEECAEYTTFPEPKKPAKPTSQSGQIGYLVDIANKYIKRRTGLSGKDLALGGYRIRTTFEKSKVRALAKAVDRVREERLDPKKRAADREVQVGAASIRPRDGAIVAAYGGSDAVEHFTNNADTSGVPVGSAFKPFVYAAVLEHGAVPEAVAAEPDAVPASDLPTAARADDGLSGSLVAGENTPYLRAGEKVGLRVVRDMAVRSGLLKESLAELEPEFSIGTSTPSAVRMAGAYASFVNKGTRSEPYAVTEVEQDGVTIDGLDRPRPVAAMDPEVAAVVSASLSEVAADAIPSTSGFRLGPNVLGARTGPNDRLRSAWYIGATPGLSTAVTMFRSDPEKGHLLGMNGVGGEDSERGSAFPPLIWHAYQRAVDPDSLSGGPLSPAPPAPAAGGASRVAPSA
ncbi:transglycosylase domain-containing protein [Streptomyces sp. NPDC001780]